MGTIHSWNFVFSKKLIVCAYICLFPELARNREFYRTHDVRPPFTYVDMIRQVLKKMQNIF